MKQLMKKIHVLFASFLISILFSCGGKTNESKIAEKDSLLDSTKNELWADVIEYQVPLKNKTGSICVSFDDEYWKETHVNMDYNTIFNTLVDAVISGKIKVYNMFDSVMTIDKIKEGLTTHGRDSFSALKFREKWIFNKESFKIEKQINRITLLADGFTETGEFKGYYFMFYLKLND